MGKEFIRDRYNARTIGKQGSLAANQWVIAMNE